MSLQDDIARYEVDYHARMPARASTGDVAAAIAAGLERDYYLVKLADLQPVGIRDGHYSIAGVKLQHESRDLGLLEVDRDYAIAVYEFAKARESEAAVLARRRDELVQRYSPSQLGYDDIQYTDRRLVDHALDAEDRAAAAEAELARVKGEKA